MISFLIMLMLGIGVFLAFACAWWRSWLTSMLQWCWALSSLSAFFWVLIMSASSNTVFINHPLAPMECLWKSDYSLKDWIRDLKPDVMEWKRVSHGEIPQWLEKLRQASNDYQPEQRDDQSRILKPEEGSRLSVIEARAAINFRQAWTHARMGDFFLNSLIIATTSTCLLMLLGSMAAHGLCRFQYPGRKWVYSLFVLGMTIPIQLLIIPLFLKLKDWNIAGVPFLDSRIGLILLYTALSLPFTIFLLSGFWRGLPHELAEAAAMDGCGEWRIFTDIYFPLARPGLLTAAILNFLGLWNELNLALIFITNPNVKTLPVGLYNLQVSTTYAANWPALFAGLVLLLTPTLLVFLFLQRHIIAGLTVGGVKE